MNCPTCIEDHVFSKVEIVVSNKELIERIKLMESKTSILDDINEYNLLCCLNQKYPKSLCSSEIASEIDCSWQFVNKRAERLMEKALIEIDTIKSHKKRYYKITLKARELISTDDN